jgi:hypothetical protein
MLRPMTQAVLGGGDGIALRNESLRDRAEGHQRNGVRRRAQRAQPTSHRGKLRVLVLTTLAALDDDGADGNARQSSAGFTWRMYHRRACEPEADKS